MLYVPEETVKTNKRTIKKMFTSRIIIVMVLIMSALVGIAFAINIVEKDTLCDGTELVFAFMVHRHGDRTPEQSMDYSNFGDVNAINALIEPWGYGQLTNNGIRTSYKTGEFIRRRYEHFIPAKYNHSEVYIRSTDFTRTKMSALTAMAAVFPPTGETWHDEINWVPVPYSTVEAKYDFMLSFPSCTYFVKALQQIMELPVNMTPYHDTIEAVSIILNDSNLTQTPLKIFYANDLYTSLIGLGFDVGDAVRPLLPDIAAAAAKAWDVLMADDALLQLEAGVLLNEFFTHANDIIAGNPTEKVRIYSAHDINVYSFEAACRVAHRQGIPKYGSLLSLELRRVRNTGQYVVLPVHLPDPHEQSEKYLQIEGCDELCDYDKFHSLTQKYLIDEASWRTKCGITEDSADVILS